MPTAMTLTAKGQFTLNKPLLEHLGIKAGEKVIIKKLPNGSVNLEAEKNQIDILSLAGIAKTDIRLTDDELDESIRQSYIQRGMRGLE